MRIRTTRGDRGLTDLIFKKRISKNSPEIWALGDLDELMTQLGIVKVKLRSKKDREIIGKMQEAIHMISSEIAIGPDTRMKDVSFLSGKDLSWMESVIFEYEKNIHITHWFHLPGKNEAAAFIDMARTVARRAERSVLRLFHDRIDEKGLMLSYMNCISDVLYLMAREKEEGGKKIVIKRRK